mmetsp:Transcript_161051/g.285548  ORF Transcript_161051/g.285548 Transcript_161051/m.285548 type:complete len:191 (-) Transcript_161051:283-855(-)
MWKIAVVLAVLAYAGHAQKVAASDEQVLVNLLRALKPAAAFTPSAPGTPRSSNSFDPLGLRAAPRTKDSFKSLTNGAAVKGASFLAAAAAMIPEESLAREQKCYLIGALYKCTRDTTVEDTIAYIGMFAPGLIVAAPFFIHNKAWREYLEENPEVPAFEGRGDNVKWNWPRKPFDDEPDPKTYPRVNGRE